MRVGARGLSAAAVRAVGLIWRSARVGVPLFIAMTLAASAAPIATAWLTKTVIDRLTTPHGAVGGPALGLAATGVAAAALPVAVHYLRAQIGRSAGLTGTDRLFAAAERQVGLRNFEDTAYQDRLRLAQEGVGRIPEI